MLLAKYTYGPVKFFGGYEYIKYMNPSDDYQRVDSPVSEIFRFGAQV